MGMFDAIFVSCPHCDAEIEFQSEPQDVFSRRFDLDDVPADVAACAGVEACPSCDRHYVLESTGRPFGARLRPLGACRVQVPRWSGEEVFRGDLDACRAWIEDHDLDDHAVSEVETGLAVHVVSSRERREQDRAYNRSEARKRRQDRERTAKLAAMGIDEDVIADAVWAELRDASSDDVLHLMRRNRRAHREIDRRLGRAMLKHLLERDPTPPFLSYVVRAVDGDRRRAAALLRRRVLDVYTSALSVIEIGPGDVARHTPASFLTFRFATGRRVAREVWDAIDHLEVTPDGFVLWKRLPMARWVLPP